MHDMYVCVGKYRISKSQNKIRACTHITKGSHIIRAAVSPARLGGLPRSEADLFFTVAFGMCWSLFHVWVLPLSKENRFGEIM